MALAAPHCLNLITLGDSTVGKTTLIHQFCHRTSQPPQAVTTIGVDLLSKVIDRRGKKVKVQVWDTAGQEKFQTLTKDFFRRAQGVLLVYSVCDRRSFERVESWIAQIGNECVEGVQIVIVGNKTDLSTDRVIPFEEGEAFARGKSVLFFEVSGWTGDCVEEAFLALVDAVAESRLLSFRADANGSFRLENTSDAASMSTQERTSCCQGRVRG